MTAAGLLVAALTGCDGGALPVWAVQHGSLDVSADGISGFQVWELYDRKWQRSRDEAHHRCAVVQEIRGSLAGELEGCVGCTATYRVTVTPLETDCSPDVAEDPGLSGMRHFAFGDVGVEQQSEDPFPGRSVGWYVGWDGETAELMGFAWDEELEQVDGDPQSGWGPGARYVYEPIYAWEL